MRLTLSLFSPRMWVNMRGQTWYKAQKRGIPDDANVHRIVAAGYNIEDATEFVKLMSPLHRDYEALPGVPSRFPEPPKDDSTNPDWHDETCKVFNDSTFPIEGVQQALAFTKGVQTEPGLPVKIKERADALKLTTDVDQQARRIVQQAFLWDAYLDLLPNVKHVDFPSLKPKREYGIPWKRSNEILMTNFIRTVESKLYPDISLSRMVAPQEELRVNMRRHQSLVQFRLNSIVHLMSANPASPIRSSEEVEDSKLLPLCDIYPFLSTANMEETNIYKEQDHFGVKPTSKFPHIHTSIFSHHIPGSHIHLHPRWTDDRFAGATIMYNFATALLMAKRKFGAEFRDDLPQPITTQVIHLTGQDVQFSVFQLNTLNLDDTSSTSVKNNVWFSEKMQLFGNIKNDYGKEIFEGYNPEVFKLFAAMYAS